MAEHVAPLLYALFVWWFSTGLVLLIIGLPRRTYPVSMAGATVLMFVALYGLAITSADASVSGAYIAFTCALLVWAWPEMSLLTGLVTGPRRLPCPPGCTGWLRFQYAFQTILYHELALLAAGAAVAAATWNGSNKVGAYTFLVLWVMRLSAKLNLFLGVRTANAELLPSHLQFLASFFAARRMNFLFPLSVAGSTIVTVWLAGKAWNGHADSAEAVGYTLLAALMALAVLEHVLMMLPLPASALWGWSLRAAPGGVAMPSMIWRDADDPRMVSLARAAEDARVAAPAEPARFVAATAQVHSNDASLRRTP